MKPTGERLAAGDNSGIPGWALSSHQTIFGMVYRSFYGALSVARRRVHRVSLGSWRHPKQFENRLQRATAKWRATHRQHLLQRPGEPMCGPC
jgi:hypothetical protein